MLREGIGYLRSQPEDADDPRARLLRRHLRHELPDHLGADGHRRLRQGRRASTASSAPSSRSARSERRAARRRPDPGPGPPAHGRRPWPSGSLEIVAGFAPSYLLFVLLCPLLGISVITVLNSCNALLQTESDPAMRGRVMAIYMTIVMGGTPIGSPLIGWIGEQYGARWTLVVGGVLVLVGVGLAVLVRSLGLQPRALSATGCPRLPCFPRRALRRPPPATARSTATSGSPSGGPSIGQRGSRRGRHVLHDGLHRGAEPADPRLRARHRGQLPRWRLRAGRRVGGDRGRHRPGRGRADDPDGRRRQLPPRARDRAGAQRLPRLLGRQPDDLGRRDGPHRDRGCRDPRAGADGVPRPPSSARSRPSSRSRSRSGSACSSP